MPSCAKQWRHFPRSVQEMEISRLYCTCNRSSGSPCLMAEGVKTLLQGFLKDFEVVATHPFAVQDVLIATEIFRSYISSETSQGHSYCLESWKQAELVSIAEDILVLLTFNIELWDFNPPAKAYVMDLWKWLVDNMLKWQRYFCVAWAYACSLERVCAEDFQGFKELAALWLLLLKDAHLELERRVSVNSDLRRILKSFAGESAGFFELMLKQMRYNHWYHLEQMRCNHAGYQAANKQNVLESQVQFIFRKRDDLRRSMSKVTALASQVEEHVSSLRSPEMESQCSWSLVSEVESMASDRSVDSQASVPVGAWWATLLLALASFQGLAVQ